MHSDQGLQYSGAEYRRLLQANGARASMSCKANCWDDAVVESFFASLKKGLVHHGRFQTRQQTRNRLLEYIEVFYNRDRLHSTLGYLSPYDFERRALRA